MYLVAPPAVAPRAPRHGGPPELVSEQGWPFAVAAADAHVYWSTVDEGGVAGNVFRRRHDGGAPEIVGAAAHVAAISLDDQCVYATDSSAKMVVRYPR